MKNANEYLDRIQQELDQKSQLDLVYQWIRTGVIDRKTFHELITWIFQSAA